MNAKAVNALCSGTHRTPALTQVEVSNTDIKNHRRPSWMKKHPSTRAPIAKHMNWKKEETKEHLKYKKHRFQRVALGVNLGSETESPQRNCAAQIIKGSQNQSDHWSQQNTFNTVMLSTKKTLVRSSPPTCSAITSEDNLPPRSDKHWAHRNKFREFHAWYLTWC